MTEKQRAIENVGPHLLGRKPMPRDDRDYLLADFLDAYKRISASGAVTADSTLQQLVDEGLWKVWHDTYAIWAYVKTLISRPSPTPPAPSPAPMGVVTWQHGPISDQGQTGHCVGFTGLDWGNCAPINDQWPNGVGDDIYYECKVIDGEPHAEDGSNSRSLCKALKARGRVGAYAFAASADEAVAYIEQHGPVGIGVDWYNRMFEPASGAYILDLSGGIAGGHEIMLNGYDRDTRLFTLVNHWGVEWADQGCAYLRHDDLDRLLALGGDCWAALEQPL